VKERHVIEYVIRIDATR